MSCVVCVVHCSSWWSSHGFPKQARESREGEEEEKEEGEKELPRIASGGHQ